MEQEEIKIMFTSVLNYKKMEKPCFVGELHDTNKQVTHKKIYLPLYVY